MSYDFDELGSTEEKVALKSRLHVIRHWRSGVTREAIKNTEALADDDWFCGELPDDLKKRLREAFQTLIQVHEWTEKRAANEAANQCGEPSLAAECGQQH